MLEPRSGYATEPRVAAPCYPGVELSKRTQPQRGCAVFEFPQLCEMQNGHNPVGVAVGGLVTQGSREARQPWAVGLNRFAVEARFLPDHDLPKSVGQIIFAAFCALAFMAANVSPIRAQNPAPNTETLKKANTRPAEPAVAKTDPWDGASIEKMTGQCVTLDTELGAIVFEMVPGKAPETVRSYLNLAATGALDTTTFSRVVKGFVIQGGNLSTSERWSAELAERMSRHLPDEPSDVNHVRGIVSMARGDEPGSATTHFFILVGDGPHLDGKFAAFGRVISGIEVADAINRAPSENEKPVVPVRIKHAGVAPCRK
jgi:peptidyl-prolyl cis-trans isomerase B (cyclophilin B)